jgi:enterochelin esterase family protein
MIREDIPRGTVTNLRFDSEVLQGNPLGDPTERDLFVYLPPGYDLSDERYPSVYCLAGFTGRGGMMLNDSAFAPNLAERMDRLIATGTVRPMILVMPDCFTYYGGSQYLNSTATGRYEDYVSREIVAHVDANLRTAAQEGMRAVVGKSSGGYGALIMGMRHADVFSMVCSIAGDAYFEYCYPNDFAKAFRVMKGDPKAFTERIWTVEKQDRDAHSAINTIGMSACYSPSGEGFDLPFNLETGEMRPDVWQRWLEHDPVRLVEKYAESLKSLKLLFLDAGRSDEFSLDVGAKILSKKLSDLGVDHISEQFDGGHFGISWRLDRSLELISNAIAEARA